MSALLASCGQELRVALAGGYSSSLPRLGVPLPGRWLRRPSVTADGKPCPVLGHFVGAQWWSPGRFSRICRFFLCSRNWQPRHAKKKSLPPLDGTVSSSWRGGGPLSRVRTAPLWRPRGLPHASFLAPEHATQVSPSRWLWLLLVAQLSVRLLLCCDLRAILDDDVVKGEAIRACEGALVRQDIAPDSDPQADGGWRGRSTPNSRFQERGFLGELRVVHVEVRIEIPLSSAKVFFCSRGGSDGLHQSSCRTQGKTHARWQDCVSRDHSRQQAASVSTQDGGGVPWSDLALPTPLSSQLRVLDRAWPVGDGRTAHRPDLVLNARCITSRFQRTGVFECAVPWSVTHYHPLQPAEFPCLVLL